MSNEIKEKGNEPLCKKLKKEFRKELQECVKQKLDEVNFFVAGCDSPFTYLQILDTQEKLREIIEILGIEVEDSDGIYN